MAYQGAGLNGADGLGLRLKLPKSVKRGVKKLGRGLKRLSKSPTVRGAVIGATAGFIYGQVRKRQKAKKRQSAIDRANEVLNATPRPQVVDMVSGGRPTPPTYIEPPNIPMPVPSSGGMTPAGDGFDKVAIANKIMSGVPLTDAEMAYVRTGALGQGMIAAAEAAYGSDFYQPGAGQPLPGVTVTAEKDNTMLYAGLGLVGLLLLTSKRGN